MQIVAQVALLSHGMGGPVYHFVRRQSTKLNFGTVIRTIHTVLGQNRPYRPNGRMYTKKISTFSLSPHVFHTGRK